MAKKKKNLFALPPAGNDIYLVVRIPKKSIKPGMKIGEVNILPTEPVLGCTCNIRVCCDGWAPCIGKSA